MQALFFPPGSTVDTTGPLARFLPPLEGELAPRILRELGLEQARILDPFGASPRLAIEIASSGCSLLVAASNPITRFVLQRMAEPMQEQTLRGALARIAGMTKEGTRIEQFIQDLYRTVCSHCGEVTPASGFVWDREQGLPVLKQYTCKHCGQRLEEPTDEVDRGRAQQFASGGLQSALALEELAPAGDPFRKHAEAALDVYTGRNLYALITIIEKAKQLALEAPVRVAAQALLLYAFDACNALWSPAEGRARPKQLSRSPQFREQNVWFCLEDAVEAWTALEGQAQVTTLTQEGMPASGQISIFPGSVRDLADRRQLPEVDGVVTVLPRPNQAFWTLAALWTAWLWGREVAATFKVALRRRRYDWNWHAAALRATMGKVTSVLAQGTPVLTFIPEAEPGFLAAPLAGLDGIGFVLRGRALRVGARQALLLWHVDRRRPLPLPGEPIRDQIGESINKLLNVRGVPSPYLLLHAAVLTDLAAKNRLDPQWGQEEGQPLTLISNELDAVLSDRKRWLHLSRSPDLETGQYWLVDDAMIKDRVDDRIEAFVLHLLRSEQSVAQAALYRQVYAAFPGLLSPDEELLMSCAQSYAEFDAEGQFWAIRPEDQEAARGEDMRQIQGLLQELGLRLGYRVDEGEGQIWCNEQGYPVHRFRVQATAYFGSQLMQTIPPWTLVVPGGRAGLIMQKAQNDPRLQAWLRIGVRVVKFRHVRRLEADTTLTTENLIERLGLDPPHHQDPQLPLL